MGTAKLASKEVQPMEGTGDSVTLHNGINAGEERTIEPKVTVVVHSPGGVVDIDTVAGIFIDHAKVEEIDIIDLVKELHATFGCLPYDHIVTSTFLRLIGLSLPISPIDAAGVGEVGAPNGKVPKDDVGCPYIENRAVSRLTGR